MSAADRADVERLYDQGSSPAAIAAALHLDLGWVNRTIDRYAEQVAPLTDDDPAPVLEPLGGPGHVRSEPTGGYVADDDGLPVPGASRRPDVVRRTAAKTKTAPSAVAARGQRQHGTLAGYHQHKRRHEEPCQSCTDGARESWRVAAERVRATGAPTKRRASPNSSHGTYGGYQKHQRTGTEMCLPCRDAGRAYSQPSALAAGLKHLAGHERQAS